MSLRGITFDLWDTLVHDDSDELERAARDLPSKAQERRLLFWESLTDNSVSLETVSIAYDTVDAAFNKVWKEHHITWPLAERLEVILLGLKQERPSNWEALVEAIERMEVDIPPVLIDGCAEALSTLSQKYKLAVVSDAIVTPGSRLRELLENHGILRYFSAFAFSDEVRRSKPHPDMFFTALQAMKLKPHEVVHIGDRDHNDIKGAQALGMKAILFTATRNVDQDHTTADAVCDSYAKLLETIVQLDS